MSKANEKSKRRYLTGDELLDIIKRIDVPLVVKNKEKKRGEESSRLNCSSADRVDLSV